MYCLRVPSSDGVGEFLQQDVGLAIEHLVALLDGRLTDGLGQMALARAARAEEQRVFAAVDEGAGGEVEDQTAIHLRVEGEVEVVERLVGIAEAGLFAAPFEQAVGAARELVGDQHGEQVDGRHGFGLRLAQAGFQHGGHAAEAKLAQRALQFNEIHAWLSSWVLLVDEVAVQSELADDGIHLAQAVSWGRRSR